MITQKGKVLYCVIINIQKSAHEDWLDWMQNCHIPEILKTGRFQSCRIGKQKYDDQGEYVSYQIEYLSPSWEEYQKYMSEEGPVMQAKHNERYHGKFTASRTLFHIIRDYTV